MSGKQKMIIRVQSAEGTARVEMEGGEATAALYERVHDTLELSSFAFTLHRDRQRRDEVVSSKSRTLADVGLRHGDLLYLSPVNGAVVFDQPSTSAQQVNKPQPTVEVASTSRSTLPPPTTQGTPAPMEDEVDLELYKLSGTIQRQRDEKLCRHNSKGCCVHCSPLEPWDEGYLKEQNIKHMSFHSYLRKMQSKNFIALEELSFKIKPGCTEHPPWPRGICSKCQPGAVTLNRQPYRHVDNVLVEHGAMVERFLAYWRATGRQRLGYLYGSWERHPTVPLGVRARVAAIYEPAQASSRDHIALLPDDKAPALEEVAGRLGLRRLGWIFTDLVPLDTAAGTVRRVRGGDAHLLSAQECIMAGHFQNEHPSACRHSASGWFGSKHVTVVVSGDAAHRVALDGYQVSQQCAALVRDRLLLPTKDAPELAYVRDSTSQQYVPDVYYKERDAYGNEVCVAAKRVPVEYLLVDVPCGVAAGGAAPTFPDGGAGGRFPPAHRADAGQPQALGALHALLEEPAAAFLAAVSDLHVLLYLATNEALPLAAGGEAGLAPLLAAVRARDAGAAEAWRRSPQAATLATLARAAAEQGAAAGGAAPLWTCQLCTFHNAAHLDACEMCAMPRNASGM